MSTARQIAAYRKRLATISERSRPGAHLTAECLNAVVSYYEDASFERIAEGTLVGFGYRIAEGLLGRRLVLDITVCDACVHRQSPNCGPSHEHLITDATVIEIVRNGDREAVR